MVMLARCRNRIEITMTFGWFFPILYGLCICAGKTLYFLTTVTVLSLTAGGLLLLGSLESAIYNEDKGYPTFCANLLV